MFALLANELPTYLGNIVLFILSPSFGLLILLLCCVLLNRRIFGSLLTYAIFSTFVNAYLKGLWRVPLKPGIGHQHWYSYPSGHTQFAIVVCYCLAIMVRSWKLLIFLTVLLLIYTNLIVYRGFHIWDDIVGAIAPGLLLVLIFFVIYNSQWYKSDKFYLLGFIMILIEFFILLNLEHLPCETAYCKFDWLWVSLGFSSGLFISWPFLTIALRDKDFAYHEYSKGIASQVFWTQTPFYRIIKTNSLFFSICKLTVIIALVISLNLSVHKLRSYFLIFHHIETLASCLVGVLTNFLIFIMEKFGPGEKGLIKSQP